MQKKWLEYITRMIDAHSGCFMLFFIWYSAQQEWLRATNRKDRRFTNRRREVNMISRVATSEYIEQQREIFPYGRAWIDHADLIANECWHLLSFCITIHTISLSVHMYVLVLQEEDEYLQMTSLKRWWCLRTSRGELLFSAFEKC